MMTTSGFFSFNCQHLALHVGCIDRVGNIERDVLAFP